MAGESLVPEGVSTSFLVVLAVHIAGGLTCVVCIAGAAVSRKGERWHVRFGQTYLWALAVVTVTMLVLGIMRWPRDNHLVALGIASAVAGWIGLSMARRTRPLLRRHAWSMASSAILLFTAFYVDNGPNLPVWKLLPHWAFWVLPALVGIPLTAFAVHRNRARLAAYSTDSRADSAARAPGWIQ
ncbi:hypothetical protein GCM10027053_00150 [Intrasporangium mesophilum]